MSVPAPEVPHAVRDLLRNDLVSAATVISLQAQMLKIAAENGDHLSSHDLAEIADRIDRNLRPILAALTALTSVFAADPSADGSATKGSIGEPPR